MKIAFSSNAFTNYSLIDSIKMISQVGYGGIEIMSDVPHAYPPNLSRDLIAELKKTLKENNLGVSNLNAFTLFALGDTYHPSWIETSQEKRVARINHTINCIDLAYQLGARNISVEPGGPV
ncbi:MAG TPA: TIM barrel protein, partial [Candidatus Nitrosocosmicus sp.]|nr:TIM barrel protein [Candidatus Nitrosocosmicus sp.]